MATDKGLDQCNVKDEDPERMSPLDRKEQHSDKNNSNKVSNDPSPDLSKPNNSPKLKENSRKPDLHLELEPSDSPEMRDKAVKDKAIFKDNPEEDSSDKTRDKYALESSRVPQATEGKDSPGLVKKNHGAMKQTPIGSPAQSLETTPSQSPQRMPLKRESNTMKPEADGVMERDADSISPGDCDSPAASDVTDVIELEEQSKSAAFTGRSTLPRSVSVG